MNQLERFWVKIEKTTDCWIWKSALRNGYGLIYFNGRNESAHRVSYRLHKGEIPSGLQLDHLCRNRACVNPNHLEAVTSQENIRRGLAATGKRIRPRKNLLLKHCTFGECKNKQTWRRIDGRMYYHMFCQRHVLLRDRKLGSEPSTFPLYSSHRYRTI